MSEFPACSLGLQRPHLRCSGWSAAPEQGSSHRSRARTSPHSSSHPSGRSTHPRHTAAPEGNKPTPITSAHRSAHERSGNRGATEKQLLEPSCSVCPVQLSPVGSHRLAPHPTHHQHCHLEPCPRRPHGRDERPGVLLGVVALHGPQALLPVVAPCKGRGCWPHIQRHQHGPVPGAPAPAHLQRWACRAARPCPAPSARTAWGTWAFRWGRWAAARSSGSSAAAGCSRGSSGGCCGRAGRSHTAPHPARPGTGTCYLRGQHAVSAVPGQGGLSWVPKRLCWLCRSPWQHGNFVFSGYHVQVLEKVLVIDNYALDTTRLLKDKWP